jgi:hypothetical protein
MDKARIKAKLGMSQFGTFRLQMLSMQPSLYAQMMSNRSPPLGPVQSRSGHTSPPASGYQTPREVREERWRLEAEAVEKPGKIEMREMYKELNGRKSKTKGKLGGTVGIRDKGGWTGSLEEGWD